MDSDVAWERGQELGRSFVEAVSQRDAAALAGLFAPEAVFRAVVPNEERPFREKNGGHEAAEQLRVWFEDADVIELLESEVSAVADRVKIRYCIHVHEPDGCK